MKSTTELAGGPEIAPRYFLLAIKKAEGAPGSFFEPGSWVGCSCPVSPNLRIPDNSFHTLNSRSPHSNDTS
jgi:hypothetical protein